MTKAGPPTLQTFLIFMMQIHFRHNDLFVFYQSKKWWQPRHQTVGLLIHGLVFSGMSLVSSLQTERRHIKLFALSTILRSTFSQGNSNDMATLEHNSFLQFSILRLRSLAKSSFARAHGCSDFRQMHVQKTLRLFQMNHCNHCIYAHQCRLCSVRFCLQSAR